MQDNALIELFLPIITSGLNSQGFANIAVVQSNQPTQQGINTPPTVYFFKVGDHRYGFPKYGDIWDSETSTMNHTEIQVYETTFQVSALVIQDPTNINFTASDLVNAVAGIIQSYSTVQALLTQDVQVLRVTDVRNPYFTDDKGRFEASPSFDFTLTHKQISESIDEVVQSILPGIYRV